MELNIRNEIRKPYLIRSLKQKYTMMKMMKMMKMRMRPATITQIKG